MASFMRELKDRAEGRPCFPWAERRSRTRPLFDMSIKELQEFVESEKQRSAAERVAYLQRKRHTLLLGEVFHPAVSIETVDRNKNRGLLASRKVGLGTVIIRSRGIHCEPSKVFDFTVLQKLLISLGSRDDRVQREARTTLKRWKQLCPLNPTVEDLSKYSDIKEQLLQLLAMHPHNTVPPLTVDDLLLLLVKLSRNSFASGIFPLVAYANHSCRPNCAHFFSKRTKMYEIRTLEEVAPGTEFTISYLSEAQWYLPTDQRRSILKSLYQFHCTCRRCDRYSALCTKKILSAELASECLRCQMCIASNNFCFSLDDHSGKRTRGYTKCHACGQENDEKQLDALMLKCYYDLDNALSLPDTACQKCLIDLHEQAKRWLHPGHWVMYKLHFSLYHISKDLSTQAYRRCLTIAGRLIRSGLDLVQKQAVALYAQHITVQKKHAVLLLDGIGVYHEHENLTCMLKEQAALALRKYCTVVVEAEEIDRGAFTEDKFTELRELQKTEVGRLKKLASRYEREAMLVQKGIRGVSL